MMQLPPQVLAALPTATRRTVRAEWSNDGGATWESCKVGSAEVKPDRTAECRWSGSADLVGVPVGRDGVNVAATHVRLWEGIAAPRSDVFWVPAGWYVVDQVNQGRAAVSVTLLGLEDVVRGASLPVARSVETDSARAIAATLIAEALPRAPVSWRPRVDADAKIPAFLVDEDRWQALSGGTDSSGTDTGIAPALGAEVYADARGVVTFAPVPTVDDPVVWRLPYGTGRAYPARQQSAEGLVNCWVISGDSGDGQPAVGPVAVWDDDPNSLTYAGPDPVNDPLAPQRLGLHGVRLRVERYSSALITGAAQAQTVGEAKLADSLGVQSSLSFDAYSHPGIEPGDVVEVEVDPGVWQRHIIDSVSRKLGAASMSCQTRTAARRL
ncbi:phage tail protein [Streptomyces sp. NRRL F-5630]|uniref:phage tail protein n=1 Tax=Streptomyces sp. NRRL F-5630 TaxID=1463864 RepID=UPI003D7064AB